METKKKDVWVIVFYYILIALSGWLSYEFIKFKNELITLFFADFVMTVVCFALSMVKKNSSVYDAYWSVIPFYMIVLWVVQFYETLNIYHWIVFTVISIWSWRLTLNWVRSWHGFTHEDWRYINLANATGKWYPAVSFSGIHLFPTVLVFGGMIPLFFILETSKPIEFIYVLGITISFTGILFQFFADNRLYAFRNKKDRVKGEILEDGLWGVVRYPNYLGEMMLWIGVAIVGISFNAPTFTLAGALAMVLLFVFISIPMKEKRMHERRNNYADYCKRVPRLIPFTKRKS